MGSMEVFVLSDVGELKNECQGFWQRQPLCDVGEVTQQRSKQTTRTLNREGVPSSLEAVTLREGQQKVYLFVCSLVLSFTIHFSSSDEKFQTYTKVERIL